MKTKAQKPTDANTQEQAWCLGMHIQKQMDPVRRLNLEADIELQRGHHAAAERLAFRALQLQGWA